MAKTFNPSGLSPADQAAFQAWQQKAQGLLQGGGLPAELSYAYQHPEYLTQHPELKQAVDVMKGTELPETVKNAVSQQLGGNTNFDWSGGQAGIAKHKGIWSQPETWIQIALGSAIGGAGAAGAFSGAAPAAAAPTAAGSAVPASIGPVTTGLAGTSGTTAASSAAAGGGLLGTIGKVAKAAGPIGEVAGQAAGAAAKGRIDEGELLRRLYESQLLGAQQQHTAGVTDAELQIKQMDAAAAAKKAAIKQALLGGLLQGAQDVSFSGLPERITKHMPTMTGGLRPSAIVGKEGIGQQVQSQAQSVLDKPPTFATPTPYQAPTAPTMPSAGAGQTGLGYLGLIGSLLGAYSGYVPGAKKTQQQP